MQLDALIKLLEAKEIGKKTQASILGETGASISRYKRDKNPSKAEDQNKPGKCHYCGRAGHGTNENGRISKANREVNCPAFTATCNKCSLTGHFSAFAANGRLKSGAKPTTWVRHLIPDTTRR